MNDTSAARWLTYRELATEAGLSLPAAEARARRMVKSGKWRHRIDNDPPNAARVLVPVADLEAIRGQGAAGVAQPRAPGVALGDAREVAQSPMINELLAELKASHEQVAGELRCRADAAEARIRDLAEELSTEREARAKAEGEGGELRRRVDRAEVERDAARTELADWTAGGPMARAWRAFLNRRGRA